MQLPESRFDGIFAKRLAVPCAQPGITEGSAGTVADTEGRAVSCFSSNPRGNNEEGFSRRIATLAFFDLDTCAITSPGRPFEEVGQLLPPAGLPRHKAAVARHRLRKG